MARAAAREESSRSGELLNDAYELHELLESDAEQHTYRATDQRRSRTVKIRLLRAELALQAGAVQRFLQVPKTMNGLEHPNLSQVLAVESDGLGIPFVVEEDVQGEPLTRTVESFPQGMPLGVAINLLCPVVEAVAAAHARGVVHGKLQLQSVLLANNSVPKLTCFGPAPAGADLRSDVWALGALLYRTLSGQTIERPGSQHEPLEDLAPHLPPELTGLVERCLRKDPNARPADACVLNEALSAARDRMRGVERKPAPAPAPVKPVVEAARKPAPASAPQAATVLKPKDSAPAAKPKATPAAKPQPAPAKPQTAVPADPAATVAARPARSERPSLPQVDADELALAATIAATEDDEPELSLEAPAAAPPEQRTLSDLAAAFGPIEGSDRIGQSETESSAAARSFRKAFDDEERDTTARRGRPAQRRAGAVVAASAAATAVTRSDRQDEEEEDDDKAAALASRKQLRDGNKVAPRALSDEAMRKLREHGKDKDEKRDRLIGALFFFLFVIGLALLTPVLCDPTHKQASELLGTKAKLVLGGFNAVTVIALIRTWSIQIATRPMLMRPVTTTLKVVTVLVCVLTGTFFLPPGALGPIERLARLSLPWASSFFYLFLAFYGLLRSARDAASNATAGIAMGTLYCMSFFGSYRVLDKTVLARQRQRDAALAAVGQSASMREKLTSLVLHEGNEDVTGLGNDAGVLMDDGLRDRKEIGSSEEADMSAIHSLEQSRKKKGAALERLQTDVKKIAK